MKFFAILLLCLFSACLAEDGKRPEDIMNRALKSCAKQLRINPQKYSQDDPQCLQQCVFKKLGIVTGDCDINVEKLREVVPQFTAEQEQKLPECQEKLKDIPCCKRIMALNLCVEGKE